MQIPSPTISPRRGLIVSTDVLIATLLLLLLFYGLQPALDARALRANIPSSGACHSIPLALGASSYASAFSTFAAGQTAPLDSALTSFVSLLPPNAAFTFNATAQYANGTVASTLLKYPSSNSTTAESSTSTYATVRSVNGVPVLVTVQLTCTSP